VYSIENQENAIMSEVRSNITAAQRREKWLSSATLSVQMAACLIFVFSMPHLANARDFTVPAGDVAGLINAITMANRNPSESNRIILGAGIYTLREVNNDTDGPNGLPSITNVLTIGVSGGTAVIERAGNAPPFRILHGRRGFALFNITIRGGDAGTGNGGGIFNRGAATVLFSSTVSGNKAFQGGGIFNSNSGLLTLSNNSIIDSNQAADGGGGILNQGGLSVIDSTIRMNRNGRFGGGGILNLSGSTLSITNSTVNGNTSGAGGATGGGGIFNLAGSTLTITNSTISGNSVPEGNGRGGGVDNRGTLNLSNVTVTNNTAEIEGGGIFNSASGTVNLKNTLIGGNFTRRSSSSTLRSPDCHGTLTSEGFNLIGNTGARRPASPPPSPACLRYNRCVRQPCTWRPGGHRFHSWTVD
jgi:hypothetical protein